MDLVHIDGANNYVGNLEQDLVEVVHLVADLVEVVHLVADLENMVHFVV